MRILVVEDDEVLGPSLVEALEDENYAVDLTTEADEADELAAVNEYDLILLDWTLPGGTSGLDLLRKWRERGEQAPVLMLTARKELGDRVAGLDTGADDYLAKPFAFEELFARVRSLLRRRQKVIEKLVAGDVELDRASQTATVAGEPLELAPKEFGVLEYLMTRKDEPVSRTELSEHVWDETFDAMSNVIDVVIYRLRKKIDHGRGGKLLRTKKGVGYVLRSQR